MEKYHTGGIDYGGGVTNIDIETGIRYGIISYNSICGDALNDVYTEGKDLNYESYVKELEEEGKSEEEIEELLMYYYSDNSCYRYEQDGYILETSSLGLFVLKSLYYTRCRYCSPCVPGGGDLNTPDNEYGIKTYCLGKDWFDNEKAPYKIEEVKRSNIN